MSLLYRMGTGNGSGGDLKPYTVNFECASGYIGQTLTMKQSGQDNVSGIVGSDGKLTLYPMYSGEWECSCYSSVTGTTMIKTIDLSYWGVQPTVTFEDTPNGATVTPTDDVQTWLHCANIWDKTDLTTIDNVIADTTTLNILISDNNASDYLARSTTFATDICNNESAMIYIGLNDYCANKLLSNSIWLKAICSVDETLFTKVLNEYVPQMTDYTEPSGSVTGSSEQSGYPAWRAFDKNTSTQGWTSTEHTNAWIVYEFDKRVKVNAIDIVPYRQNSAGGSRVKDFILQGYDGNEWKDIYNDTFPNDSVNKLFSFINNMSCTMYRLYVKNNYATNSGSIIINELQFYGRASS